jgi:hypothetical protein
MAKRPNKCDARSSFSETPKRKCGPELVLAQNGAFEHKLAKENPQPEVRDPSRHKRYGCRRGQEGPKECDARSSLFETLKCKCGLEPVRAKKALFV